ncbi:MAG: response regulator [Candidatus Pacebacteria bacterium]|nr:response regulator [Candidatus Paceibacterota bacterium]
MEQRKKILIVDDDSFLVDMYALKFGKFNFSVTGALSAKEALDKIRSGFVPDIILVDVVMPEMDGFDFMEKMKSENLAKDSIKIILSNRGQQTDIVRGESLGAVGYVVKASSTPTEVIEKINEIINNLEQK